MTTDNSLVGSDAAYRLWSPEFSGGASRVALDTAALTGLSAPKEKPRTITVVDPSNGQFSIEEALYNSRAAFKIKYSTLAMHLDGDWRHRLFSQIDSLLDVEEWEPDDLPVSEQASVTFLRMILFLRPRRRPGLGATKDGHLVASWTAHGNRLTLICGPTDRMRFVISTTVDGQSESAAGSTTVQRLPEVLAPYRSDQWFRPTTAVGDATK